MHCLLGTMSSPRWTEEMDEKLVSTLVERHRSRPSHAFNSRDCAAVVNQLYQKYHVVVIEKNVRDRLKILKKKYLLVNQILTNVGFQFDYSQNMVIAEDYVWENYIQVYIL